MSAQGSPGDVSVVADQPAWHAMPASAVLAAVDVGATGLTSEQAAARLAAAGLNRLPSAPQTPAWVIFLRQFQSPLIYILAAAAGLSLLVGETTDAAFIGVVLLLNSVIGGVQEYRADRSTRALQKLLRIVATVQRDGQADELDAEQIVPGDIVWLESGDRVPADMRLLSTHGLEIDESLLTGESVAVSKHADALLNDEAPLGDRVNMAYAGSAVSHGRGKGVVVATGAATNVGMLALDVAAAPAGKPPLLERLERFTKLVGAAVIASAGLVLGLGVFWGGFVQGEAVMHILPELFIFSVALAVAAVPEGMPVAITVALAIATSRMAARGVIVRKLGAVEGLGSCTMIASDKTGTLTCNELTVQHVWTADGRDYAVTGVGFVPHGEVTFQGAAVDPAEHAQLAGLMRACVLCNEGDLHHRAGSAGDVAEASWTWRGDPTDVALLTLGAKMGWRREATLDAHPQVNEIPFESERQFSATFHRELAVAGRAGDAAATGDHAASQAILLLVKGAPERVLAMCDGATDAAVIEAARARAETLAAAGCRVLAIAQGQADAAAADPQGAPDRPRELTLLGLVGMIDPLRTGVREAVKACGRSGLRVCMVTGDHPVTASAIGQELGIDEAGDRVVTGAELEAATDAQLDDMVRDTQIFARVPPHQKLRIVESAQRLGHFVAVTGDGVNDAPALRKANIGVAMGKSGTDVAREAADLVISDDNFATIVSGVEAGRIAYSNVRNVIFLLISTGAAEVVMVLLAVAFGYALPLLPVQLLWLNLVTNGIQHIGLAFESGQGDELDRKPRNPGEPIFNRLMLERTVISALVMGLVGFVTYLVLLEGMGWSEPAARNGLLLLMVLFENVHVGNCRSETLSAFALSPLRSPILLAGTLGAQLLHIAAMYAPLGQSVLETQPIGFTAWLCMLGLASSVLWAMELHKRLWRQRT